MKIMHWMKKEDSGLARSTLELCKYEEKLGHQICIKQPEDGNVIYGSPIEPEVHNIHSQLNLRSYYDKKPKLLWMHGEPLSSVGNGISMKAIVDLAPLCEAFICMRKEEVPIWSTIKRTHYVPKGIDLEEYKPLGLVEKLSGAPAVLYYENWRGQRNPLYLCVAMQKVWQKYPDARLHLYNCSDKRMHDTFSSLISNNKWWTFIRSLKGKEKNVNMLLNKVDMVVSCLHPLYARGIEAFGAGKAFIGPGYKVDDYPYTCELDPDSMAAAIIKCWENYNKLNYRKWAEAKHDAKKMTEEAIKIYGRYL